jgi:hypothetical protein
MTPEEKQKLKEEIVREILEVLGRYDKIPFNVERAFSRRLRLEDVPLLASSAVSVGSFTQAVDEGGSSAYDVAKPMTDFISIIDGNGNSHTVATYD